MPSDRGNSHEVNIGSRAARGPRSVVSMIRKARARGLVSRSIGSRRRPRPTPQMPEAKAGISLGPLDGTIVSIKDLLTLPAKSRASAPGCWPMKASRRRLMRPWSRRLRAGGAVIVAKTNMRRICVYRHRRKSAFRIAGQSCGSRRVPGGSSSRRGRRCRRWYVRDCDWYPTPAAHAAFRCAVRHCRLQAESPAHSNGWCVPAFIQHRFHRPDRALCRARARADAVMANETYAALEPVTLAGIRVGSCKVTRWEDLDETVHERFSDAIARLNKAGARISEEKLPSRRHGAGQQQGRRPAAGLSPFIGIF